MGKNCFFLFWQMSGNPEQKKKNNKWIQKEKGKERRTETEIKRDKKNERERGKERLRKEEKEVGERLEKKNFKEIRYSFYFGK